MDNRLPGDAENVAPAVTDGSTIWRYMRLHAFRKVIKDAALYLPNAYAYEDTDVNEGRYGRRYVDVLRRAFELMRVKAGYSPTSAKRWARLELSAHCALLQAYRQYSYISCWTLREQESRRMWRSFVPDGEGVAIKSTVGKVYDNLISGCSDHFGELRHTLVDAPIIYDRERAHLRLDLSNADNVLHPLFSLDGGAKNFKHEREYRFVVTDSEGAADAGQDYLRERPRPTLVRAGQATVRTRKHPRTDGVLIPIDLKDLIMEARIDPRGGPRLRNQVNRLLERHRVDVEVAP